MQAASHSLSGIWTCCPHMTPLFFHMVASTHFVRFLSRLQAGSELGTSYGVSVERNFIAVSHERVCAGVRRQTEPAVVRVAVGPVRKSLYISVCKITSILGSHILGTFLIKGKERQRRLKFRAILSKWPLLELQQQQ